MHGLYRKGSLSGLEGASVVSESEKEDGDSRSCSSEVSDDLRSMRSSPLSHRSMTTGELP